LTVGDEPEYRLLAFPVAFLAVEKFGLAGLIQQTIKSGRFYLER
jgi:hypothetical protein